MVGHGIAVLFRLPNGQPMVIAADQNAVLILGCQRKAGFSRLLKSSAVLPLFQAVRSNNGSNPVLPYPQIDPEGDVAAPSL